MYEEDEIQRRLGLDPEGVEALGWLLEFLPQLENTVVLIAGRPWPERLRQDLKQALGDQLTILDLNCFDLEDTEAYFDAVAEAAQDADLGEPAERIEGIPKDVREVIWRYTEGRPILLALMIDYLVVADELLPRVKEPVEEVRQRTKEELERIREEIEADLIRFWQETGRRADQAVVALAWARKGMDAELLARVAELRRKDGKWDAEQAQEWLDGIRDLSFVKIRPADNRVFLHDEMYDLLDRHVLAQMTEERRERVYSAILDCYGEKVLAQRERVRELWTPRHEKKPAWDTTPLGQPRPPDQPHELALAINWLYNLMSEEFHYRLRRSPVDGYQTYQVYAKESFWAGQESLDHLLRSEILLFLDKYRGEDALDGVRRGEVEIDLSLRRLERYNRTRYPQAREYAQRIRDECADLLQEAGFLAQVRLDILEGESLSYLGSDFTQAESLLQGAISALQEFEPATDLERWQWPILLAEANNNLGYLYRTLGWFQRAVDIYGKAVAAWRRLEQEEKDDLRRMALRAQHANTLNNLSWARAEMGDFEEAGFDVKDALSMRKVLGPRAPVAFSENTLGLILTREGNPGDAQLHCARALGIFRDLEQPRGIGLASIALAESLRRDSSTEHRYAPEESADLLRRAEQHATDAVEIFREQVLERPRLVEALVEQGCVYRQWAWLRPYYTSDQDPGQEELAGRSEVALKESVEVAGKELLYRGVDAQVNLAWSYYFTRKLDDAENEARQAIEHIPSEYYIAAGQGMPDLALPHVFFWVQLGKAHLLLGEIAGSRFLDQGRQEALRDVGEHYTLSLAYDALFAPDFRDLRRGMQRMYVRLRKLNLTEFELVHQGMAEAVKVYALPVPNHLDKFLAKRHLPQRQGVE